MIQLKYTYLILLSVLIFSSKTTIENTKTEETIVLLTSTTQFTVGDAIVLKFSGTQDATVQLYCSGSYGATLLDPVVNNKQLTYTFPSYLSHKIGVINWKLLTNKKPLSGQCTILPSVQPATIETYLGPPSIEAGEKDFAMLVVIPTDNLDNPVKQETVVNMQHQFLTSEETEQVLTNNFIAYKHIYSTKKSGRILVSSNCLGLDSKEFDINVMPGIARDFEIFAARHHEYADGNQITTFTTSILKDANGNIVSDGSFVEFFITNAKGNILKTSGMTINGIATASMLHPDHEEQWSVKAYIIGIAESNIISLKYKKIIETLTVAFSKNNRNIQVGPLKSFMNQLIPDGLQVKLIISQDGKQLKKFLKESREGYVNFKLNPNIFSNGNYNIQITAAGITQQFQAKKLW